MTDLLEQEIKQICETAENRIQMWRTFINKLSIETIVEIGVFKGQFAAEMLASCPSIKIYHLIDPWRQLPDWNKPINRNTADFDTIYRQAKQNTAFASEKTFFHRGTTKETIHEIENSSIEFIYIDGDHSLRGITIDLINAYQKVQPGGYITGDDCYPNSIVQHGYSFEPTLVYPFVAYFAEANNDEVYFLPHGQYLIQKTGKNYKHYDLTGKATDTSMKRQITAKNIFKRYMKMFTPKPI